MGQFNDSEGQLYEAEQRIAELEAERDDWKSMYEDLTEDYAEAFDEKDQRIAELEAHCDELQCGKNEALDKVAELEDQVNSLKQFKPLALQYKQRIAELEQENENLLAELAGEGW